MVFALRHTYEMCIIHKVAYGVYLFIYLFEVRGRQGPRPKAFVTTSHHTGIRHTQSKQ